MARFHHRDAVRPVTGPDRALRETRLGQAGDLDLHVVRLGATPAVLRGHEERRHVLRVRGLPGVVEHPAGGVEVPPHQALVVQQRALQVVTALAGREEAVPDQVLRGDPEGERLVPADLVRELRDEQRGIVRGRAHLTESGAHAAVSVLETVVRLELAVGAVLGQDAQPVPVVVTAVLAAIVVLAAVVLAAVLAAVVLAAAVLATVVLAAGVLAGVGEGARGELVEPLRPLRHPPDRGRDPVQRRLPLVGQRPQDRVVDEVLAVAAAVGGEPPVGLGDLGVQQGEVAVHLVARLVGDLRKLALHVRAGHGGRAGRGAAAGLDRLALGDGQLPVTPVVTHPATVLPRPGGAAPAARRGGARAGREAGRRGGAGVRPPVLGRRDLGHGDDSAEDRERADNGQQSLAPRVTGWPARPCGPAHRIALLLDPVADS